MRKCKFCTVESLVGTRNFKMSNWCKTCARWKPKENLFCECCNQRVRFNARRTPSTRTYIRM